MTYRCLAPEAGESTWCTDYAERILRVYELKLDNSASRNAMQFLFYRGGSNEFLEPWVLAQRFKHWVQPKQRRSQWRICG